MELTQDQWMEHASRFREAGERCGKALANVEFQGDSIKTAEFSLAVAACKILEDVFLSCAQDAAKSETEKAFEADQRETLKNMGAPNKGRGKK